jgi:hypothetical protein
MSAPARIGSLIARDLSRRIEEIIKVDQVDEQSVHTEITEYVVTGRLREHYRVLLKAIADYPADPHEGTGVWVSGFFGSGKSSFAKNLGYVVGDRTVLGQRAADLFKAQVDDPQAAALIDSINRRLPTEVVMFDVQTDRASGGSGSVSISHYLYRALLRALDYAEDFDIAELEQSLEADGRLEDFVRRAEARFGPWRTRRKMAQKMNEASAVLHEMDRATYTQPDSWARGQAGKRVEITPAGLVEKTFELAARRRPGKAITFVVDEVGAYVARSAEKIEDLRAVVEQFGKTSKNLVRAKKAPGPVWVIVTSQEKLEEVVAAIDSKRVELAKLQDRFATRVDLAPADIREVATRRVLGKTDHGRTELTRLYERVHGQLNTSLKLEWPGGRSTVAEGDFVEFYPYPPHFIDLSIDIMSGIRIQPGAPRHLGGSNRTIIKQAFEMLVSERTGLARAEVGRLVTMDLIFELVEGNLATEKQKDISDISAQFGAASMEARVAKAVVLLEFVRGLSRSEANLAATLVDRIDAPAPLPQVRAALQALQDAKFVRNTEEGYKLQTQSEKTWETQRRSLDPKPRDRNEILREMIAELFAEPALRSWSYKTLRTFRVGLTVDDVKLEDGQIPLRVITAENPSDLPPLATQTQAQSRQPEHQNDVFWVFALSPEVDALVGELFRSQTMITRYDQLRAQGKISPEESSCLAGEKTELVRYQGRLRERLGHALQAGSGLFRGLSRDGSALGKSATEVLRRWFDATVPELYAKLELGSRPLKGTEAEEVLKAANLGGLSQVFYDGEQGLGLVVRDGARYVPNVAAPIAKEILDFIEQRAGYGERVSGRDLENRFTGLGYGWEREVIQLVLAVLLRAGSVELTYQGRRFRGHQDAVVRTPFTNTTAFRATTFSPTKSIGLKVLTTAAERLEELTGEEVEIEESVIAQAFKRIAAGEQAELLPLLARVRAHRLPAESLLTEFATTLDAILASPSDDCVRDLAAQGKSFKETLTRVRKIRDAVTDATIASVETARQVLTQQWPLLERREVPAEVAEAVERLKSLIESPDVYEKLRDLAAASATIDTAYGAEYSKLHEKRNTVFLAEIDSVKGRTEWPQVSPGQPKPPSVVSLEALLTPLEARTCHGLVRAAGAVTCGSCRATLAQMESDLAAAPALRSQILMRLQELTRPEERVERIRLAELLQEPLDSQEAVDRFVEALRAQILKFIAEGSRVTVE